MATRTPFPGRSESTVRRRARQSPRQLWQVPVFVLGLLVLMSVCFARPSRRSLDLRRVESELATARQLLDKSDADCARVVVIVERLLDQADRFPQRAGEAHFLLGSAYLRLVEKIDGGTSLEDLGKARSHLEQADQLGVPDGDRLTLIYRLGKTLYLAQEDPQRVIALLSQSVGRTAEDAVEGYALLTQAYLRLPVPNLDAALEANRQQLQQPTDNISLLTPVRLLRGELLLRKQNRAEAQKVLEGIRPPAPPPLVAQARFLLARSYQEEERWAEAARLWEEVLAERFALPLDRARVRYFLGVCYRHLDKLREAARVWEEDGLWKTGSDEGTAAALGLAEVHLLQDQPDAALEAFQSAVRYVKNPVEWQNSLVDLNKAREVFERGYEILLKQGEEKYCLKLAKIYETLAPLGTAAYLYAGAAESLARLLSLRPEDPLGTVRWTRDDNMPRVPDLFLQAGAKYEASAEHAPTPAEQAKRLWRSADCYLQAQNHAGAVPVLERFVKVEQAPEQLGRAWFLLGEAHRKLKQPEETITAYERSTRYRSPFEFEARYQLALLKLAAGAADDAEALLERNLTLLGSEPDRDSREKLDAQEKSLFALSTLLFQRQKYAKAIFRLELALKQCPSSPRAVVGRFQLAESYRNLATQVRRLPSTTEDARATLKQQYRTLLEQAATEYQKLADLLITRQKSQSLTGEEESLLRQAAFAVAEVRMDLGPLEDTLRLYYKLANDYQGRPESLHALAGVRWCYYFLNMQYPGRYAEDYRTTLDRIRQALSQIDDKAFTPSSSSMDRKGWEDWLAREGKKMGGP